MLHRYGNVWVPQNKPRHHSYTSVLTVCWKNLTGTERSFHQGYWDVCFSKSRCDPTGHTTLCTKPENWDAIRSFMVPTGDGLFWCAHRSTQEAIISFSIRHSGVSAWLRGGRPLFVDKSGPSVAPPPHCLYCWSQRMLCAVADWKWEPYRSLKTHWTQAPKLVCVHRSHSLSWE